MERLVQVADVLVRPIDGQRVLNEIVRADGEEIRLGGQNVRDNRGGRHLDHDSDRNIGIVRDSLGIQLRAQLAHERLHLPQLLHAGDDREHDLDLAERRGAKQRAQLRAEHVAMFHAQPQSAQT